MPRQPLFSSLPYEIVSQICQQPSLDKDDLAALRLTCKSYGIHNAATASLGKHFEDITVPFSEQSFQTLVNICKHPVFSGCVRSVKLSSIRCNSKESIDNIVQALQGEATQVHEGARLKSRSKNLHDLSARIRSYASRTQSENEFARSTKPLTLLTRALQVLAQADARIALGIAFQETNSLGCGKAILANDTFSCLWLDASSSALGLLTSAVSKCGLSSKRLKIDILATEHPYESWPPQEATGSATADLFSHMEALDLGLVCFRRFDVNQDIVDFVQQDILKSIQIKALRLKSVDTLELPPPTNSQRILRLCKSIPLLSLESLSLVGIETTMLDLQAFLARVRGTLRHLSIVSCELDADLWMPAVNYIRDHLTALDELHLTQNVLTSASLAFSVLISESEKQKKQYEDGLLACIDLYGQGNIQSSLTEVLTSYEKFVDVERTLLGS